MDLPSRYSMDPVAFHTADEQLAADERRIDLWDEGPALPQPFKKLAVHFETPRLEQILRKVEGKGE